MQIGFDMRSMNFQCILPNIFVLISFACAVSRESVRAKLLQDYDLNIIPSQENDVPTRVGVHMTVNHFSLVEEENTFLVNAWIKMTWKDSRLAFNANATGGAALRFGTRELWKPDITLYNNAYPTEIDHYGDTHMLVSPDGTVLWVPPSRLAALCTLNMIRWPYDTHTCELKFGSWTHHGHDIDLYHSSNETGSREGSNEKIQVEYLNYVANSEWKLLENSAERHANFYKCCPEPYVDLTFSFTFQRNSPSYNAVFVIPIVFISMVNMMVLLLPPTAGEKVTLGALQFFVICIYLLYFQAKVPPMGDHLPLLVLLYICNLVLVSISLFISVITLNLARTRKASSLPQCFRVLCNPHFATVLGLGHFVPFISKTHSRLDDGVELQSSDQSSERWNGEMGGVGKDDMSTGLVDYETPSMLNADWIFLATMINRIAFIVYAVVNGILLALCLA